MKVLKKFGVAAEDFTNADEARGATYTTRDNKFPPTKLACPGNPYIEELNSAKYILDFGCGVGRNLPWIMDNTNAHYVGLDPNTNMTQFFWEVQKNEGHDISKWKPRVTLINEFSQLDTNIKFDYVVTTFVLQHLGYRYVVINGLNLTEITKNILSRMNDGAVFFSLEHDAEEYWIDQWLRECNIKLDTYIRGYKGLPELAERDFTTRGMGHHLMIFKHRTENEV
jgi:SAM-dependent methyltransferase